MGLILPSFAAKIRIQSDDPSLLVLVCREFQRRLAFIAPDSTIVCASNWPAEELEVAMQENSEVQLVKGEKDIVLFTINFDDFSYRMNVPHGPYPQMQLYCQV